jgi:hypothetical protein
MEQARRRWSYLPSVRAWYRCCATIELGSNRAAGRVILAPAPPDRARALVGSIVVRRNSPRAPPPMPNRLGQPRSAVGTVAAAAALAVVGYVGSASGFPTVWSPLPLATTLPIFWFWEAVGEAQSLRWVVDYGIPMLMGPLLLLAWHPRLAVGADDVPRRSFLGLVLLSVLAAAHFVFGWNYGLKYQSQGYVRAVLVLNVNGTTRGVECALGRLATTHVPGNLGSTRPRGRMACLDRLPMARRATLERFIRLVLRRT